MKNWSEKHLRLLASQGKLRGYHIPAAVKKDSGKPKNIIPPKKTKGLVWLEWNLEYWCKEHALTLTREHQFCPGRKFRFDFCVIDLKIAVEFEGGIYQQISGHNTAKHYTKDTDKYNWAAVLGWRVIRVTAMNYKTVLSSLNQLIIS